MDCGRARRQEPNSRFSRKARNPEGQFTNVSSEFIVCKITRQSIKTLAKQVLLIGAWMQVESWAQGQRDSRASQSFSTESWSARAREGGSKVQFQFHSEHIVTGSDSSFVKGWRTKAGLQMGGAEMET